jgi:nucleoside-diphosphate-sugar epimerase
MMRYLVTGGAGFIGSNTVDELVRRGQSVVVLDDLSTGKEENLAGVRNRVEFVQGSVTDLETVRRACRGVDYVLHLAARTSVPRSLKDPLETNHVNVDGTLNVLVAARDARVRRVVFAASSSVYGETPTLPKRESHDTGADFSLRCLETNGRSLWTTISKNLRAGVCFTALFQRIWSAAGPQFAIFRRVVSIQCGSDEW